MAKCLPVEAMIRPFGYGTAEQENVFILYTGKIAG